MAQQLYFSRDTRMFVQFRNPADNTETAAKLGLGALWEIPVLDGYSFSQTTNTSEITLAEMESTAGISRRGKRVFTDSLAPAEWSFSTYIRPFKSLAGSVATGTKAADSAAEVHAVEEVLWASMFGADTYSSYAFTRATNAAASSTYHTSGQVVTPAAAGASPLNSVISLGESNRSAMTAFTIFFLIDTATSNPLVYRLPEAVVNEVSVDFDVDGIATLNWSGFAKEVQDVSGNVHVDATLPLHNDTTTDGTVMTYGDIWIDTDNANGRAFHLVTDDPSSGSVTVTQAIDEATTSTKNFIRNRLTSVNIEAADGADKITTVFPGSYATVVSYTSSTVTATAHGFAAGDQVYISGATGETSLNTTHLYVGAVTTNTFKLYDTYAKGIAGSSDQETLTPGSYDASSATASNGKYSLTLTGGSFTIGNNITYLVPEELGAINKPLEHVTGTRNSTGNATCYMTLEDSDTTSGTSRQFFNDLVSTGAMSKTVNKFKVTMHIGGATATGNATDPALKVEFPTAHIEVPSHSIEDVISLETNFQALPTDFGAADEISAITYYPVDEYT